MDEEKWLKAIKCSKEELIEWLNEMYNNEKINRDIIRKYEDTYNVEKEDIQEQFEDPVTMTRKFRFYTKVKAHGFEYCRNWS